MTYLINNIAYKEVRQNYNEIKSRINSLILYINSRYVFVNMNILKWGYKYNKYLQYLQQVLYPTIITFIQLELKIFLINF